MDYKDKLFLAMTGVALGTTILLAYSSITGKLATANKVYFRGDLNIDGKDDLIVESKGGHKTPLYAVVQKDGSINYVSADEYKKMHPTNITDYERIEDILNKK